MSKSRLLIVLLLFVCIFIWVGVWQKSDVLEVIFFDVGQGDAILILFPYGGNMLIDGGEKIQGERVILPYLRKKGIRKIDTVVLTHAHSDHVGGLIPVLKTLPVGLVVESGLPHTTGLYMEFLELIDEKKIPYKMVHRGQELTGFSGVKIEFLNPPHPFLEDGGSDVNNNSVVIKLNYGGVQFLFCADIEKEAERELLNYGSKLRSLIIKVPHHGSKTSSSWEFIKEVNPEAAIISAGRGNRFGHPDSMTLMKYKRVGSEIYRTDVNGAIIISTDGRKYKLKKFL
jgi:competence protein ComEC